MKHSPGPSSIVDLTTRAAFARPSASKRSGAVSSALALLLSITTASAQQKAEAPSPAGEDTLMLDTFVVSEVRNSLINAQEIKENASGFVDSIVAQDIGKLPDNTVGDALQ